MTVGELMKALLHFSMDANVRIVDGRLLADLVEVYPCVEMETNEVECVLKGDDQYKSRIDVRGKPLSPKRS